MEVVKQPPRLLQICLVNASWCPKWLLYYLQGEGARVNVRRPLSPQIVLLRRSSAGLHHF